MMPDKVLTFGKNKYTQKNTYNSYYLKQRYRFFEYEETG